MYRLAKIYVIKFKKKKNAITSMQNFKASSGKKNLLFVYIHSTILESTYAGSITVIGTESGVGVPG